jgi:hypothetical protein
MLEKGECSLLRIQTSFPLLLQFSGILLSVALFVYRTSNLERKRYLWSTSTSLLLFHVVLYITFLGMLLLICFHAVTKLCTPEWACILLTLLNWIVNGASLHFSILPKFDMGVYMQVMSSVAEVIFVLYTCMHVLLEAEVVVWWYWPVLLGVIFWCFLCNIGFLTLLYGGKARSSSTGSALQTYALLEDMHGEQGHGSGVEPEITEEFISLSVCFFWFTEVLQVGHLGSMTIDDLPSLPISMTGMSLLLTCFWTDFIILPVHGTCHHVTVTYSVILESYLSFSCLYSHVCARQLAEASRSESRSTAQHSLLLLLLLLVVLLLMAGGGKDKTPPRVKEHSDSSYHHHHHHHHPPLSVVHCSSLLQPYG